MDLAIRFDQVSKRFILHHEKARSFQEAVISLFHRHRGSSEEFWALQEASFEIARGESLGIIGENGSGKSTALKLITRILEPTRGKVTVKGKVSALLELGAGFHPDLTGRENIFLNGSILGMTRREMNAKYEDIVRFAELERFIDTPIKHFSSGMYARLGFAVAISVEPDILVIDEVLAVGDETFQRKCVDKIGEIKAQGTTIILVSHSLGMVKNLCSHTVWLDGGRIRAYGDTGEVVDDYLEWANLKDKNRLERGRPVEVESGRSASGGPANRWGSRQIEIVQVELLGDDGRGRAVFETGETFVARLHFVAHQRVDMPVFGVAIFHSSGVHINGPNTRFSNFAIDCLEGRGTIDFRVDSLPLLEGAYEFSAAVYDYSCTHAYDHHHRLYPFHVQPRSVQERYGMVYMPCCWELVAASNASVLSLRRG